MRKKTGVKRQRKRDGCVCAEFSLKLEEEGGVRVCVCEKEGGGGRMDQVEMYILGWKGKCGQAGGGWRGSFNQQQQSSVHLCVCVCV